MGDNSKQAVQKKSFWKGMKAEFAKIIWPDKKDIAKETAVVTVVSIILGILIVIIDVILKFGINWLINL